MLGVRWSPVRDGRLGEWAYRIVFSADGPPFLELVEGPPGSPWDASGGSRFDHLGYWVDDIEAAQRTLVDRGAPLDFDATTLGRPFAYHRLDELGTRIELVGRSAQPGFIDSWAPHLAPMPTLDLAGDTPQHAAGTADDRLRECRATLLAFLAAIDHGRATDALHLFTADAEFAARGQQLHGREQIGAFLREREAEQDRHTVHVVCNETVGADRPDRVVLDATLLLHERQADGSYPVVRALDTSQTFHRDDNCWRISRRTTRPIHPE